LSVSPKTRVPSHPPAPTVPQQQQQQPPPPLQQQPSPYNSSAKRKMDDREKSVEEPRHFKQDEVKPRVNGAHQPAQAVTTSSPQQPPKKRVRYKEPPIWAQSVRVTKGLGRGSRPAPKSNGNQMVPASQISRPPATNGHQPTPAPIQRAQSAAPPDDPSHILGDWEKTISNMKPHDAISKVIADWIFQSVVMRQDYNDLASTGVQIEIEAKLGQLMDQDTRERVNFPILTETIVAERARTTFKSSMTEAQHKFMNDWLNKKVQETHPTPGRVRVPIIYVHRRETDKFYELPDSHISTLPPAVQAALSQTKRRDSVKVRVSTEQKTGKLLGMIIKARVGDMNIYNPQYDMDCRISINLEMPYGGSLEELKAIATDARIPDRNKDRLSYTQNHYQIDLTQVTQHTSSNVSLSPACVFSNSAPSPYLSL
jgi:polynucleotide 5'-triphosphatase